ncbi:carboxymuconolactone decarboxylase family protein [Donghicola tyrosinivorans]|uniref:4-carboxymuconolactone decarboxylase n=1 Tax=Donghicola tyrosinivorans TaxID=1652492 RepID=A0A2T0WXE0_9RHOB|nr:carboxymuconolactone decarboxylase family protein [Donghicola tyrosinivorans]PRY91244.1 4-carboxymuconolactone decarboxylase [Donghicola tyrosinivorans]
MNELKNLFDQMMSQSLEMAKSVNPALESFTPKDFEALWPTVPREMMEFAFGKTMNPEGLDSKTRLLLTLAGLTCQGAVAEPQIRLTVRHALEAGATKQEIAEAIGQMAMFAGIPAMTKAATLAQEVMAETKDEPK